MFGSHDHDDDKQEDKAPVASVIGDNNVADGASSSVVAPAFDTSNISLPEPGSSPTPANDTPAQDDQPADNDNKPATSTPAHDDEQLLTAGADDDLIQIKQQALHELSPLVDHLDQSPEEKFRTTMMMIQASDDQSLLHAAFEAAKSISDDKVRAQALLDVINEINYFTQQAK